MEMSMADGKEETDGDRDKRRRRCPPSPRHGIRMKHAGCLQKKGVGTAAVAATAERIETTNDDATDDDGAPFPILWADKWLRLEEGQSAVNVPPPSFVGGKAASGAEQALNHTRYSLYSVPGFTHAAWAHIRSHHRRKAVTSLGSTFVARTYVYWYNKTPETPVSPRTLWVSTPTFGSISSKTRSPSLAREVALFHVEKCGGAKTFLEARNARPREHQRNE
ncbi:hypothetical protein F5Y19DRAFT_486377 [Xylariaceae sp. FL1651]|nr:hypothetical protein F5Y19DRAFT_486377 [Xylariaceae sp. FL1651]